MKKLLWPIYEFRPIIGKYGMIKNIYRYNNNQWIPDDGEYDLAFACWDDYPSVLYISLPYWSNILWSWVTKHWADEEPKHPSKNAWHYMLRDRAKRWGRNWERDLHPNTIAGNQGMSWVSSKLHCSNGNHVEFNLKDKHILNGLVRRQDNKTILTPPKNPICMYGCKYSPDKGGKL